jgi:cyclopropane fatty-acyl-phospholipid synthase-like methyltransferase
MQIVFKNTQVYYDYWHDQYIKFYGNTFQAHRPENLEELHSHLNNQIGFSEGDFILDAGCGICGPAAFFASHNNIRIEAITNSEKQIQAAKMLIDENKLNSKIHLKKLDYHQIGKEYKAETFDKITFLESFGHSNNKKTLIDAAFKLLKYNGYLYIKDYFATEIEGNNNRKILMKKAVKNLKKQYCYYLTDLYDLLKQTRKLGMTIEFVKKPDYELQNELVVNSFEKANNIDLFSSEYMPIIVEPLEIKLRKTVKDVRIY